MHNKTFFRGAARGCVATLLCMSIYVFSSTHAARAQTETQFKAVSNTDKLLPNAMWLENLDLGNMSQGYGRPQVGRDVGGDPMKLGGTLFPHGIGTHAQSRMTVDLQGVATHFFSIVGVDDEVEKEGAITFSVSVDGKKVFDSGVMKGGDLAKLVSVDLKGARRMLLEVTTKNNNVSNAHGDWAGATIVLVPNAPSRPESVDLSVGSAGNRFPAFLPDSPRPAIHGARIVGASPNRPFLFLVPATGKAPLTYSAQGLPRGLSLNAKSGIITGQMESEGAYDVQLSVKGPMGNDSRNLRIVCATGKLALTPPLGWNAWNVFGETVTADKIREQADWMIKSGLAAHGFQYLIIDDTWQGRRDEKGEIGPSLKFGDIKSLADYVHSKGLKLGIYSSPNDETCSGYAGSKGHEAQDAALFASWGIDYLKYDWCESGSSTSNTNADTIKAAYKPMREALNAVPRDIVWAITPYGIGAPWDWGKDIGANSWASNKVALDTWDNVRDNGFNTWWSDRGKTGSWNDPGPLMMGRGGPVDTPRFARLKPQEQMTQVSLWSLMAAPLIISCDLRQLDPNTFAPITSALLTNDEVLDVNQDPLGKPGIRAFANGDNDIWARTLSDGTKAVGLFNRGDDAHEITITWQQLGIQGAQPVRDLWQHKDLGLVSDGFSTVVPRHGVVLVKIGKPNLK